MDIDSPQSFTVIQFFFIFFFPSDATYGSKKKNSARCSRGISWFIIAGLFLGIFRQNKHDVGWKWELGEEQQESLGAPAEQQNPGRHQVRPESLFWDAEPEAAPAVTSMALGAPQGAGIGIPGSVRPDLP